MSIFTKLSALATFTFWISVQASTVDIKAAMVVSFAGTVEIFSEVKTEATSNDKTFVIFDGHKYASRRVQSGAKVHPGDVLRSGNDGKMKIIYDNGDVFILGPATAFTIPKKIEKGAKVDVSAEVLYGKVRGMIDKKGPLSGVKMNTKTAVAGVRGTDLYVSYNPMTLNTQVHVLRGEVAVQNLSAPENNVAVPSQSVVVKTGQKAVLEPKDASKNEASLIQVMASTQQDFKTIQTNTLTPPPQLKDLKPEEKKQIERLLTTSQEKVLEDIKVTTPEVYKSLQNQKLESLEAISQVMVNDLSKVAPKGSSKPKMSDFEKDEDVYKKYFKPVSQ